MSIITIPLDPVVFDSRDLRHVACNATLTATEGGDLRIVTTTRTFLHSYPTREDARRVWVSTRTFLRHSREAEHYVDLTDTWVANAAWVPTLVLPRPPHEQAPRCVLQVAGVGNVWKDNLDALFDLAAALVTARRRSGGTMQVIDEYDLQTAYGRSLT